MPNTALPSLTKSAKPTRRSKPRTKTTVQEGSTASVLTRHQRHMPTLNSPLRMQATPPSPDARVQAVQPFAPQHRPLAEQNMPTAHNRTSSSSSTATPRPIFDSPVPQAQTQFGHRPYPEANPFSLPSTHLEPCNTPMQAHSSQTQQMQQHVHNSHGLPMQMNTPPQPNPLLPAGQPYLGPSFQYDHPALPSFEAVFQDAVSLQSQPNHSQLQPTQTQTLSGYPNRSLQNSSTANSPSHRMLSIVHPDAPALDPGRPIYINGHAITRNEATFLVALRRYLASDDDTCAEILKFARHNFDPIDLTNFYDAIMEPFQTRAAIETALRNAESTWRRECVRMYEHWLKGISEVCLRKLNDGSMDINGRVQGSDMVEGNLWEEAGFSASPFDHFAGQER
ncbi:MAG: hypothetical protein Q9163_000320 [Psora crenata]